MICGLIVGMTSVGSGSLMIVLLLVLYRCSGPYGTAGSLVRATASDRCHTCEMTDTSRSTCYAPAVGSLPVTRPPTF